MGGGCNAKEMPKGRKEGARALLLWSLVRMLLVKQ